MNPEIGLNECVDNLMVLVHIFFKQNIILFGILANNNFLTSTITQL